MIVDPKQFVDTKNQILFESLGNRGYKISLVFQHQSWPDTYSPWICDFDKSNKKNVTISYSDLSPTTFGYYTHELFHIDLVDKGFLTNQELEDGLPQSVTDYFPFGHINNIFAHQRFYKDFIHLGYSPHEFIVDYDAYSIDEANKDVETIKSRFTNTIEMEGAMADFVGKFFSFIFNPDNIHKYKQPLQDLQQIDNKLYSILEGHWMSWSNLKSLDNLAFLKELASDLEAWKMSVQAAQ